MALQSAGQSSLLDQTAKVNGELTKQRQIDAGYEFQVA